MIQLQDFNAPIEVQCKKCGDTRTANNYNELIYTLNQEKWEHRLFGARRFECICEDCRIYFDINPHDILGQTWKNSTWGVLTEYGRKRFEEVYGAEPE